MGPNLRVEEEVGSEVQTGEEKFRRVREDVCYIL